MSDVPSPVSGNEFRSYRRAVTWLLLTPVSLGCAYLLASVLTNIYRQRSVAPDTNPRVAAAPSLDEVRGCRDDLVDLAETLGKHLESFQRLLGGYDPDEAQRWSGASAAWIRRWHALGRRCRFGEPTAKAHRRELEHMRLAHAELHSIERTYSNQLLHFSKSQAPRLDAVRKQLQALGDQLDRAAP